MLVLIMAAYIYTVLRTIPTPTPTAITRLNQGPFRLNSGTFFTSRLLHAPSAKANGL